MHPPDAGSQARELPLQGQAPRFYVNLPLPLAASLDIEAGETVQPQLLERADLRPHRWAPPAAKLLPEIPGEAISAESVSTVRKPQPTQRDCHRTCTVHEADGSQGGTAYEVQLAEGRFARRIGAMMHSSTVATSELTPGGGEVETSCGAGSGDPADAGVRAACPCPAYQMLARIRAFTPPAVALAMSRRPQ